MFVLVLTLCKLRLAVMGVLTRAQHAMDLFHTSEWPPVYEDALVHWLHYFSAPVHSLQSRGLFTMVITTSRHFMVRDLSKYISSLTAKKRVQHLKYVFYDFDQYINQPGVQFIPKSCKVRVSQAYWEQFRGGRQVRSWISCCAFTFRCLGINCDL